MADDADKKVEETEETPAVEAQAEPEVAEADEPQAEAAVADEAPAEEKPKPKRAPRKKAAAPVAEEAKPAPAAKARRGNGKPAADAPVVHAHAKYVRTSARKARLVCDHIRGKSVTEARAILAFTPRAVAKDWAKLLNSAVANAEHNHELLGDDLKIVAAYADEGPTLKRFQPRAMGRATRIRKRTSHLTITLTPKE
jgi:ribosomal protein L22